MVKILIFFFHITQLAWGSQIALEEPSELTTVAPLVNASVDHAPILRAIMEEDLEAGSKVSAFKEKISTTPETSEDIITPFRTIFKPYEEFASQNEVRFGGYVVSKTTAVCAGIVLCSAVLENLRFSQCTKGSRCEWVPPLFAATTGGNIASVVGCTME